MTGRSSLINSAIPSLVHLTTIVIISTPALIASLTACLYCSSITEAVKLVTSVRCITKHIIQRVLDSFFISMSSLTCFKARGLTGSVLFFR